MTVLIFIKTTSRISLRALTRPNAPVQATSRAVYRARDAGTLFLHHVIARNWSDQICHAPKPEFCIWKSRALLNWFRKRFI
jgi:hypothetical protein